MAKKSQSGASDYSSGTAIGNSKNPGESSSDKKSLQHLFEEELKGVYNAEKQLVDALPDMAKAAENEELQEAFTEHLEQTKKHVSRLEKIFERLRISQEDKTCEAMQSMIQEGKKIISEFTESPVRDAALIICAQKIEHHEIAAYGSLCELAEVLGYYKVADLLDKTLEEEEQTDRHLSDMAKDINDEAYQQEEEEKTSEIEL
jgi:ferritin-like metal-binding protein YciE